MASRISEAESEPFVLLGNQRPRIRSVPEYSRSLGEAAIELVASTGLILDEWQRDELCDWLAVRDDGKWVCPACGLVCPRQNGKSLLLAARELVGLYLLDERLIVHSSHEQATASEQFRLVLDLIDGSPEFRRRMLKPIHGKGSEAIEFRNGQRILFKTRTSGGLRGFTVDCLIFDEAYDLANEEVAAMMPTTVAAANPQILYASSAVDQQMHVNGVNLSRIRQRAIAGEPGIAYAEWSAEGEDPARVPVDLASNPLVWAQANPGLGLRQDVETLANLHATMGPRQFAVEHLGVGDWPDLDPEALRVVTVAAWQALVNPESRMVSADGVLAFDVTPDLSWGSIAGAGLTEDGKVHIGIIDRGQRFSWMASRIAELYRTLKPALIICDSQSQATSVLPELERLNVPVKVTSSKEYADACSLFAEAVQNKTISHLGDASLLIAIDGADTKPLNDAFKWDRRKSSVADISPLVAATLAHWGVVGIPRRIPEIYDLNEIVERLRREQSGQSEPDKPKPAGNGLRFVPLPELKG